MSSQPEQIPLRVPGPPAPWIPEESSQTTPNSPPLEVSAPLHSSGRRIRLPHERAAIHRELAEEFVKDQPHNMALVFNISLFTSQGEKTLTGQIIMDSITDPVMLARAPGAARDMVTTQMLNPLLRLLDNTILNAGASPNVDASPSTALARTSAPASIKSGDTFEVVDDDPDGQ